MGVLREEDRHRIRGHVKMEAEISYATVSQGIQQKQKRQGKISVSFQRKNDLANNLSFLLMVSKNLKE